MHSLSNLILQLRSLARSPVIHDGHQTTLPTPVNQHVRHTKADNANIKRHRQIDDECEDNFHDCVSNLEENEAHGAAIGRMVGHCPRCVLDICNKNSISPQASDKTKPNSNDIKPSTYCQLFRYRRLPNINRLRKQARGTTPGSRKSTGTSKEFISKRSLEFLGSVLSSIGQPKTNFRKPDTNYRQSVSTADVNNKLSTWMEMLESLQGSSGRPRLGLFIDATPDDVKLPALRDCVETLVKLTRQLSSMNQVFPSNGQIDRETQVVTPICDCVDSSVQCGHPLPRSPSETVLGTRLTGKFRYSLPFNSNRLQCLRYDCQPAWTPLSEVLPNLPPVKPKRFSPLVVDLEETMKKMSEKLTFNPGDDLVLKLSEFLLTSGKVIIDASSTSDGTEISKSLSSKSSTKNTSSKHQTTSSVTSSKNSVASSHPVYTVPEMPSTIILRPRCKDVLSLPIQSSAQMPSRCRLRSRRSYTQSDYVTKTVLTLLHDSRSTATLINSDSFTSDKSKRTLGQFLLKEKMKRILSDIMTQNQSTCQSTLSTKAKSSECGITKNWFNELSTHVEEIPPNSETILIDSRNCVQVSNESSSNSSHFAPSNDVSEKDLTMLREMLLRSCSFTGTSARKQLTFLLNKKPSTDSNSVASTTDMKNRRPKESCSFAERSPVARDGRCSRMSTIKQSNKDVESVRNRQFSTLAIQVDMDETPSYETYEISSGSRLQVVEKCIQVDMESVYYPSSTKVDASTQDSSSGKDEEDEMTGLMNWRPSLASNIFFKHLNFLSSV